MTIGRLYDDNSTLKGVKIVSGAPYCHPGALMAPCQSSLTPRPVTLILIKGALAGTFWILDKTLTGGNIRLQHVVEML